MCGDLILRLPEFMLVLGGKRKAIEEKLFALLDISSPKPTKKDDFVKYDCRDMSIIL